MSFWKSGTVAPGSTIDRDAETSAPGASTSLSVTGRVLSNLAASERRQRLPIAKQKDSLLYLLEQHPVVVLQSPTGTGKSTQIPQFLLEAGWAKDKHMIAVTQPRRVAAVSVAHRVAEEVGSVIGGEVGYSVRFEGKMSSETRILYLTDGMLFREILLDPLLTKYSVIMIDEAHERSMYTDLLLGVLKKIRVVRPNLRIIISSATIDAEAFLQYFNTLPPTSANPSKVGQDTQGRPKKRSRFDRADKSHVSEAVIARLDSKSYPVETFYLDSPTEDYVRAATEAVFEIHAKMPPGGDILVFLTGIQDIDTCLQQIADYAATLPKTIPPIVAVPLHSGLSTEAQMAVFDPAPPGSRKVICSTNVAEASVTIEGVKYVVDSGLVKLKMFDPETGMDQLVTTACSRAALIQRAGRAGRTSPGKCYRLFPESSIKNLPATTPPELVRTDLSLVVLQLKSLGIHNVLRFDWMTRPSSVMLERSLEFLYTLGALNDDGKLTNPLGLRMAEMPLDPMMSKILLESASFGCSEEMLTIAAMTSVQNVFLLDEGDRTRAEIERRKFTVEEGDHMTYLNVYLAFVKHHKSSKWCHSHRLNFKALSRAVSIRNQLEKYLKRFDIPLVSSKRDDDFDAIRKCLTSGYFRNAARLQPDGSYKSIREGATLWAHPSSVLFTRQPTSPIVIFHEVIETTKRFMRDITSIDQDWLIELAPHYYEKA